MAGPTLPVGQLSKLFDVTDRYIQSLARDGIIPKPTREGYDLIGSVRGYVAFLRRTVEQQGSGSSNAELKQGRVEYLAVQKKNAELKLQQASGKLLPIDDAEAMMLEIAAIFAGQKRSMGSRLAGKLAGMNDPKRILALLNRENDAILKNVSAKFSETANMAKAGRNTRAAAKAQPKPVGGRTPRASAGKSRTGAVAK